MDVHTLAPIAGKDYPQNWNAFLDWFSTEDACLAYLEKLRWPEGFVCPSCGLAGQPHRANRGRLICRHCRFQSSVTAGTIFSKTRTPLRVWLAAAWYLTNQKQGVSALGLQRVLGLGSYQTSWMILHRYRRAMIRPKREKLHGLVEVDETYLDMTDSPSGDRSKRKSHTHRVLIILAVEIKEPRGFGRIRLRRIDDDTKGNVLPFIQESIETGSHIRTDGAGMYVKLHELDYKHDRKVMLGSETPAHTSMPGVHRVASLIKRWLLGTHHGAVRPEQLDAYLEEFVFRFNRRSSRSRGMLFYRLLQQAVATEPVTYENVVARKAKKE